MAVGKNTRDDDAIRAGIERWFRSAEPEMAGARVTAITRPAAGLSNETCFIDVETRSRQRQLVIRLAPMGDGLFPTYDLPAQVARQNSLARLGVPVAAPARYEPDSTWLGAPFMVMPRVQGRPLSRSYLHKGWFTETTPEFRRAVFQNFVEALAGLHRHAGDVEVGIEPIGAAFAAASEYLDWATGTGLPLADMTAARDWCAAHIPELGSPASILWGDVQLTNAVFNPDGSVAALVDWEMASIGPPEMDLGWFLALHEMSIEPDGSTLSGVPGRAEIIGCYEAAAGRPVRPLKWFEVFALLRSGSIMIRMARLLAMQGVDDGWLTTHNPTSRALTRVLESAERDS